MKHYFILGIFIFLSLSGFSQSPKKAIGIRGGLSSGFEYRVFSAPQSSYKVLFSTRKQGLQLTGLKEFHIPDAFDFLEELSFVYGVGAHIGFESWNTYYYLIDERYRDHHSGPIAGLDGLAAIEYSVPAIPLVAGFEVKPYFNMFGRNFIDIQPFDFAFTIKYTF